ncbi:MULTISPECIES: dihydrodipicolinate synthase family protein [unclassified Rhizobium]|uniref:dihydrodipicolinate synthase family protein n=1 Tax=unclassified Rhizobium TaxID=2613769 RepID=UPI001ADD5D42|nr:MULTISPECIES: dihydrodipicolinate synthase family protein [unclassified Rhizobium]MBO9127712.1 dihydrodipicolinate synthase family protein [Rhizobium sp. 16-488-2b]MBO9178174.1 dihydrodipicolinate synthase family protein [Rhizobium sp. 16-488-2a]
MSLKDVNGIIPPIVTPFTKDGEIDEAAFRNIVQFNLRKKVHGVCVGGSSGEGHTLTAEEFARLMEMTVEEVDGRIPVIAGIIANSTRDSIRRAKAIAHLSVQGLQVTPVHYVFKPDENATFEHFKALNEATDVPIIIYNVIPWNYLSPTLLIKLMRDLPNVQGVKQSAGDLKMMADLMLGIPEDCKVYTAVDALLYPSFALGCHGTIAANPAAVPGVCLALWNAVQRGDHERAKKIHEALLRFWNAIYADNLPANIKTAISLQGTEAGLPRMPMPETSTEQHEKIKRELTNVLRFEEV